MAKGSAFILTVPCMKDNGFMDSIMGKGFLQPVRERGNMVTGN